MSVLIPFEFILAHPTPFLVLIGIHQSMRYIKKINDNKRKRIGIK